MKFLLQVDDQVQLAASAYRNEVKTTEMLLARQLGEVEDSDEDDASTTEKHLDDNSPGELRF